MIRDLLTPENHRDPYVWAAAFLAHAFIGQAATVLLAVALSAWVSVAVVSAVYLLVWEGAQLRTALHRGDATYPAVMDGVIDWIGVTAGAYMLASAVSGWMPAAIAAVAMVLGVAVIGYWKRT